MMLRLVGLLLFAFISLSFALTEKEELCISLNNAGDYQRAIQVGQEILRRNPNSFDGNWCLVLAYHLLGEFRESLRFAQNMEKLAKTDEEFFIAYNLLGLNYQELLDLDTALMYFQRALYFANKVNDRKAKSLVLNSIGSIYHDKGDYNKALKYCREALALDPNDATVLNNVAGVYSEMGDYRKALEYLHKALEIDEKSGNYHGSATLMLNIGDTYRRLGDYKQAESYLTEGLNRVKRIGDKYSEAGAYAYFGWLYADMEQKDKAIEYLKQARSILENIGASNQVKVIDANIELIQSGKWVPVASQKERGEEKQKPTKKPEKKRR